jgi:hypothetical protein
MNSSLKVSVVIAGLVFGLSGCAEVNTAPASREPTMFVKDCPAILMTEEKSAPVQLIAPKNKEALAAMYEAMPVIERVLGVHRCLQSVQGRQEAESLRLLNVYAVPGRDMTKVGRADYGFPNSQSVSYQNSFSGHNRSECVSVSVLDQWVMLEKNSLQFHVTYIANDTGKTIQYQFLFKKTEDDLWKLETFEWLNN